MRVHSVEARKRMLLMLAGAVLLAIAPRVACANELIPYSFDERMDKSDVVVIGKALSLSRSGASACCDAFSKIKVLRVLKGHASHVLKVFTQDEVIDFDSLCCEIGKTYLFFLSTKPSRTYSVVDGHFGAIPLD
jgi:hypothetical protein